MNQKTIDVSALLASQDLAEYRKAGGDPQSAVNQRICGRLVDREVLHCISSTVSHFAQNSEACVDGVDQDDILSLCQQPDWEACADQHIDEMDEDELIEYCEDNDIREEWMIADRLDDADIQKLRSIVKSHASDDYEEFCQDERIDIDEYNEALEHWAVTKWFRSHLASHGEIVGDLLDFDVWGRCCSGQAISLDPVIASIAAQMQILDGQKNSWKE